MATSSKLQMNLDGLRKLSAALKVRPTVQVGVFESKASRKSTGPSNADVAAFHEFGVPERGLPQRSVLRGPITDKMDKISEEVSQGAEGLMLRPGGIQQFYKNIGLACEKVIIGAFDTGGYGKWPQLAYATIMGKLRGNLYQRKQKAAEQIYEGNTFTAILVRTAQLKRSFQSRVKFK